MDGEFEVRHLCLDDQFIGLRGQVHSTEEGAVVTKVIDDNEVTVEIADGVKVRVERGLISAVMAKTEPVKGGKNSGGKGKEMAESKSGFGLLGGLFGGGKRT